MKKSCEILSFCYSRLEETWKIWTKRKPAAILALLYTGFANALDRFLDVWNFGFVRIANKLQTFLHNYFIFAMKNT